MATSPIASFVADSSVILVVNHYAPSIAFGSVGTVLRHDSYEVRVQFPNASGDGTTEVWCDPSYLHLGDLSTVEDAHLYKRLIARQFVKFKTNNGWCGTAETLAGQVGMIDYLPKKVRVVQPVRVDAQVWPDDENVNAIRAAREVINTTNGGYRWTGDATEQDMPQNYENVEQPEGQTLDEFKIRLANLALRGQSDYGVSGVRDFLRACGIDPDTVPKTRRLTVSASVEVPVEGDDVDLSALARDTFRLVLPADVTIREAWGE